MTNKQIEYVIDHISQIRSINNVNWIGLLKLAVEYAPPQKVLLILDGIDACDSSIGSNFKTLVDEIRKAAHEGQ